MYSFLGLSALAFLGALALSALQVTKLKTHYSFKQFFPKNHELLTEDQRIRQNFSLSDRPSIVFVLKAEPTHGWLSPKNFNWLKSRTQSVKAVKNVKEVFTFQTLQSAVERGSDLIIGSAFDQTSPEAWPQLAKSNPIISPQLLSADYNTALFLVEPTSTQTADLEVLQTAITSKLKSPGITVAIGGSLASQNRLSDILSRELRIFLVLSVLIFCSVFFFLFSGRAALMLIIFALLMTNIFHFAWLSFFGISLNVLLSTLPVINSISVMSLVIHSLHLWTQKRDSTDQPPMIASLKVLKELFLPNLLGTLTTSIGFIALLGAQIPIIQEYSWVIALAVLISWALVQWILLCAMLIFSLISTPPKMRAWFDRPATWGFFTMRRNKPILLFVFGITFVSVFFFPRLNFNSQLYSDLPVQDPINKTNRWLDTNMGGTVPYDLVLTAPQENYWLSPNKLGALRKTEYAIRHLPGVGSVYSATAFFPTQLPKNKALVSELLFLYSMSPEDPTRNYISTTRDSLRLAIKFKDRPTDQIQSLIKQIDQQIMTSFPQATIQKGGAAIYAHQINQTVSKKLVFGFWESIFLIGCLLVLTFRSFRWALVACIPNVIAPILMIAGLALTQTPIKPSIGLIFSISLGLAFNNTVYFLSRLKSTIATHKLSFLPIKRTLSLEGNPCLFETFVMIAGFSIFLVSNFQVNKLFGVLMILSIGFGFVADMIFLPALLTRFPGLLMSIPKKAKISLVSTRPVRVGRAASWLLFALIIGASRGLEAAPANTLTAKEILKKTQLQVDAKDETALVTLTIIEANGDKKIRELFLKSQRRGRAASTLVKISKPADVKGMGLLSQVEKGAESHWIYLPQSKQVRRVVGSQTKSGILGSELSAGDMNSEILRGAKAKLLSTQADGYKIEVVPSKKALFTKAVILISKQFLPQEVKYFVGSKPKKTVEFKDYSQVGTIWRPRTLVIHNHINKRGTELLLSNIKVNQGLRSSDFTQSALKEEIF
ncbi:MAG: outer membrane lipoprotein-sorting protein [Bdellovibrionales bacterium]|nr:outer membrane lipoprotein-sorting protein [Bdellovibrionales bacterium]